jgi:hypothetical protein
MAARALVIAIQDYPKVEGGGMARSLPGTLQAGLEFKAWLTEKWAAEGAVEPQLIFCSEPAQAGGRAATSEDIRTALVNLRESGQAATEQLYFFFSGHGFSFREKPGSRADILVTSDFRSAALSGHCCLKLDEIIFWLRVHLGSGQHYYFIDSCRNPLTPKEIQPAPLLPIDPQASGEASTFLLQSTVEGATAAVGGPFPTALIAGLRGQGKAKTWDDQVDDRMFVRYDSLRGYVKSSVAADQQITHEVKGTDGESDAVFAVLHPVPLSACRIEIENAPAQLEGEVVYRRGRTKAVERWKLNTGAGLLQLEPDVYLITITLKDGAAVQRSEPVRVDLYEDRTVVFSIGSFEATGAVADLEGAAEAAAADVEFIVPERTELTVRNVLTGESTVLDTSRRARLPPGRYFATFGSAAHRTMLRREIDLAPGQTGLINLAEWRNSPPHVAIASKLPDVAIRPDGIEFSESLGGPVADPDLDLWLAIVGGGRILGPAGGNEKLARFPLHDFGAESAGASPIYVLAGFEDVDMTLDVAVSGGARVRWSPSARPDRMAGIREARVAATPGSRLLSLRIGDQPAYTVATLASPNRAMLVTVTLDAEARPRIAQYLLPLGHLVHLLPGLVQQRLRQRRQLRDVRFIAQATRAFRRRRDLWKELSADDLDAQLDAKWLDPIGSLLAAYESVRRNRKDALGIVVTNMKRDFADLPDTAALARLAGEDMGRPAGTPLFLDGLRAFPDYPEWLPLPASHLDFGSAWTAWVGAVDHDG